MEGCKHEGRRAFREALAKWMSQSECSKEAGLNQVVQAEMSLEGEWSPSRREEELEEEDFPGSELDQSPKLSLCQIQTLTTSITTSRPQCGVKQSAPWWTAV